MAANASLTSTGLMNADCCFLVDMGNSLFVY
jgi:hypothetical protein